MPRYRFRWESVPSEVLEEVAAALEFTGDTLVQLRRRYGAKPTTLFVRDVWTTLRDGWLRRDDVARAWVVAELRSSGLGDVRIDDDAKYLASCRNAERLRRTVLIAFHDLGEDPLPGQATETPEPSGLARRAGAGFDLDASIDSAWSTFADRMRESIAGLGEHHSLIVGLPTALEPADLQGTAPYVQVLGDGVALHAEVSGNRYLDARLRLSEARQNALVALGWTAPTEQSGDEWDEGSSNFVVEMPAEAGAALADLVVRTAREVFDVPHPSFLDLPGLPRPKAPAGTSGGDLRTKVEGALAGHFNQPIVRDEDGDIPIRSGSAMVFVRVVAEVPVVELFSPLLVGASGDALALERINRANNRIRFAKLTWSGGRVMANYELWCEPFVPELLVWAVSLMMGMADEMDDRLRAEVGGRRFFEDAEPLPIEPSADDAGHPALLTVVELTTDGGELTPAEVARICGHDRSLVLELIADCESMAVQWRASAEETDDTTEREDGAAQARTWKETATLLRAALREIVLG
ncbi:MAG: T3SS (YopN, CesT) and YbjN peptide-binding chaperone 1 [Sporichthyaceae bacterium]